MKNIRQLKCWEYHKCAKKECPAYGSSDLKCWLKSGTFCHEKINDTFLEKMEACMGCPVFNMNFDRDEWQETFNILSEQFKSVSAKFEKEKNELKAAEKKLIEFKTTSVYLLKELDKKSREVEAEKSGLEEKVEERTKELKETQERLLQTARVAALSRFSAGIAHEINNPLGAVINFVRTVLANPGIEGDNKNYLELSLKGLFRIENIIKQILSYSGRRNPEMTDINKLLKEILEFMGHRFKEEKTGLKLELTEPLPPVFVDPVQIQQVFTNIIRNALDAMKDCQRKELTVNTEYKEGRVFIRVLDTGKGIKEDEKEKIFTPFFTTKEVGEGLGLGLFISYNIIQISEGTLEMDNRKESGAVVTVTLPVLTEKKKNGKN
ncbi:MAG: hypothetical protein A2231_10555 [Candidatus Firestonebacteria bacterium RIFOXYA2_FULL_40_8]|nr:MAG: hypothetical protein A2231_10555 [Candidatus Firestonebacteria bacterium RIFOXYA2_FULL_40_8]